MKRGAGLHENLQLLRSITNSTTTLDHHTGGNKASIIINATKYIKDLKKKVEALTEDIASSTAGACTYEENSCPMVTVNTLEKDFLVRVFSKDSCSGLLAFVLEAFDDIRLNVLEARVSSTNNFQLEAAIGVLGEENEEIMDAEMVKWAVSKAINKWISESVKDEQE